MPAFPPDPKLRSYRFRLDVTFRAADDVEGRARAKKLRDLLAPFVEGREGVEALFALYDVKEDAHLPPRPVKL